MAYQSKAALLSEEAQGTLGRAKLASPSSPRTHVTRFLSPARGPLFISIFFLHLRIARAQLCVRRIIRKGGMAIVTRLGRVSYSFALDLQLRLAAKYKDVDYGQVSK